MNKTAVITGASRGIGAATARLLAQNGYNVVINYLKSEEIANKIYKELTSNGYSTEIFKADVSKRDDVQKLFEFAVSKFGDINLLVNNAGISQFKLFSDISECDYENLMNINFKGAFNCCQAALPYMMKNKSGKIINISSIWGITGASCEVLYSASKAALIGLTKALAKELGPSNIQVNCVAPGIIETDMNIQLSEIDLNELKNETPLMRLGKASEIAECILFLASEKADFITGQVLSPNGGFVI